MYSWKSIQPKVEPLGTPGLTGYSFEDFPSRITQSCLLLKKDKIVKISDPKFHKIEVFKEYQHAQPKRL